MDGLLAQVATNTPDMPLFSVQIAGWINDLLVWIGFGTLVGLCAKAVMPGRDPGGTLATMLMGIGGAVIGCGTFSLFMDGQRITPISPLGLLVASWAAAQFFCAPLWGRLSDRVGRRPVMLITIAGTSTNADLLGLSTHTPRFVQNFMEGQSTIQGGLQAFVDSVKSGAYPRDEHTYS